WRSPSGSRRSGRPAPRPRPADRRRRSSSRRSMPGGRRPGSASSANGGGSRRSGWAAARPKTRSGSSSSGGRRPPGPPPSSTSGPGLLDRRVAQGSLVLEVDPAVQQGLTLGETVVEGVAPLEIRPAWLGDEARIRELVAGLDEHRAALSKVGEVNLAALEEYDD